MKASEVLDNLKRRFPNEPEYHQAVSEVLGTIEEAYNEHPEFEKSNLIERLCIPDRIFSFRVTWMDDKGQIQTNMGYRIQHNNAIGPYKGGIRFHASVNNLFVITPYKGLDPETDAYAAAYPNARTFSFGVDVSF